MDTVYIQLLSGQVNAWRAAPSSYAVEAFDENDIVNAVNFARDFNIRLVVKATGKREQRRRQLNVEATHRILPGHLGHDYYGRSSSPNSLLVWTHSMRDIEFIDNFVPAGGEQEYSAVVLGAGESQGKLDCSKHCKF